MKRIVPIPTAVVALLAAAVVVLGLSPRHAAVPLMAPAGGRERSAPSPQEHVSEAASIAETVRGELFIDPTETEARTIRQAAPKQLMPRTSRQDRAGPDQTASDRAGLRHAASDQAGSHGPEQPPDPENLGVIGLLVIDGVRLMAERDPESSAIQIVEEGK